MNPRWTRDENILALDFYLLHRPNLPGKHSPEIAELSELLISIGRMLGRAEEDTFRNPEGVYMTLTGFRQVDDTIVAEGMPRALSKDRKAVWDLFAHQPELVHQLAESIRALAGQQPPHLQEAPAFVAIAQEGRLLTRLHTHRERNTVLMKRKKEQFQDIHGRLYCEVCAFDFARRYGRHGEGFIECHHIRPLSQLPVDGAETDLSDLAVVCSNCHSMIHRRKRWLTLDDLRERLRPPLQNP